MSFDWMIRAQNLGKQYRLYMRPIDSLWQFLRPGSKSHYQDFAALQDVNFELHRDGHDQGFFVLDGSWSSSKA